MKDINQSITNTEIKKGDDSVSYLTAYHGPLPSPEILQGFEDVLPGAAERIFKMAENEQANRHKNQRTVLISSIRIVYTGVLIAFLIVLFIGFLIYHCVTVNAYEVAIALSAIVAGTAGLFVISIQLLCKKD